MPAAETFRAREVYRYYQPRNLTEFPDVPESPSANPHQGKSRHPPQKATNFNTQQSFSDTALTAFTQLIALRLETQRAIVSLIDHENEYFLAESTSTFSLIGDDGPTRNAWLSISGARVPRASSLCEQTLRLVPNQDTTAEMTPVCLVPDLRHDEKMSKLDCVKGSPYLRFYCGVALTNREGINIGCVYVVDDRPRTDFSLEQAQFLTRMAATVMDHLENIRAKEDVVRVTQMSQALHAFIEGDGTMDGDWQRLKKYHLPSGTGVGFHWESNRKDIVGSRVLAKKGHTVLVRSLSSSTGSDFSMSHGQSPLQHTESAPENRLNYNNSPWNSTSEVPQVLNSESVFEVVEDSAIKLEGVRDREFTNDHFFNLLLGTFSRASNLIREGMEVDGAVFFDAPFRFYQGRSTLEPDPRREKTQQDQEDQEDQNSSESEDEEDGHQKVRPGPRPLSISSPSLSGHHRKGHVNHAVRLNHLGTPDGLPLTGLKSDVLGFSTLKSSSLNKDTLNNPDSFTAIDQSLLTSLVRRYPLGELFVVDKDGPIASLEIMSPEDSQITLATTATEAKRARHRARKRTEILRLLVSFPGARQIFFVPLYDSTSGCFIGSFAWSTSETRIFSIENHLSYLVAFGHSVMTEVSRLNTLSADRAKGDFINNVSHELRSPLHGILASVEFLADTTLDGFQRSLIDTVDICGRTLLDTIEHVLDFTKIKKFGQENSQPMGVVADLDVSAVIEEVLEGVYAGFEYNGLSSKGLADTTKSGTRDAPTSPNGIPTATSPAQSADAVIVILDIDFRDQWKFPTVPGTWRRLTMNIFGNALKYTRSGYIKIKLEARSITPVNSNVKNDGIERTLVTLTITDSGQGMSADFLKTKLFNPFSQEDVTAPGTGIGMSIVKQIVDLSGGRIDIRSEQGKGTEVVLSLPLEDCPRDPSPRDPMLAKLDPLYPSEDPIDSVRRRAHGRTVTIRGFDGSPGCSEMQLGAIASLKASLERYATDWFNLTIVSNDEAADIVLCDETVFLNSSITESKFRALLILCSNSARRGIYAAQLETGQTVEFVSKPCGPHRLAKALLNCLDTEDAFKKTTVESVSFNESRKNGSSSVSFNNAKVRAGRSKSWRVIGNLQSPIGFSLAANDLAKASYAYTKSATQSPLELPLPTRKSDVDERMKTVDGVSSGSSSREASERSPTSGTPNSSTSLLEDDDLNAMADPEETPEAAVRPKMLLVEDNPVNMMLLSTYMKRNNWEFEMATNGLIALQIFQSRAEGFDVIFMDVSMPIMTGYESTRRIRATEHERRLAYTHQQTPQSHFLSPPSPSFPFNIPYRSSNHSRNTSNSTSPSAFSPAELDAQLTNQLTQTATVVLKPNKRALIIALTGFSSEKDQEMAFEAGVDVFMTKPVRFREVGRILEGWMRRREMEGVTTEVSTESV